MTEEKRQHLLVFKYYGVDGILNMNHIVDKRNFGAITEGVFQIIRVHVMGFESFGWAKAGHSNDGEKIARLSLLTTDGKEEYKRLKKAEEREIKMINKLDKKTKDIIENLESLREEIMSVNKLSYNPKVAQIADTVKQYLGEGSDQYKLIVNIQTGKIIYSWSQDRGDDPETNPQFPQKQTISDTLKGIIDYLIFTKNDTPINKPHWLNYKAHLKKYDGIMVYVVVAGIIFSSGFYFGNVRQTKETYEIEQRCNRMDELSTKQLAIINHQDSLIRSFTNLFSQPKAVPNTQQPNNSDDNNEKGNILISDTTNKHK